MSTMVRNFIAKYSVENTESSSRKLHSASQFHRAFQMRTKNLLTSLLTLKNDEQND